MIKFSILAGCVATSLLLNATPVSATDDGKPPRPELQGAWQIVVTLREDAPDCTTADIVQQGRNPFPTLHTFHRGGTVSEFGTRSPPSTRTAGHGTWKRTGWRSFEYRSVFFSFDANQELVANMDFRGGLKLTNKGAKLEGVSRLVRTEVSGLELRFCATLSGERISL